MEDNVMERKFGNFTLDELKKACEICLSDNKGCSDGCPMNGIDCNAGTNTSTLELIKAYEGLKETYTDLLRWYWSVNKKYNDFLKQNNEYLEQIKKLEADNLELKDKAEKYDSVRNELIRTQELLKNSQDECRKRAEKIKDMLETIDAIDDDYNELDAKLKNEEMVRKSLEVDIKNITDQLERGVDTIHRLTKEKNEANEALLHYRTLMNSLRFIGEAMRGDQSGNHEKD